MDDRLRTSLCVRRDFWDLQHNKFKQIIDQSVTIHIRMLYVLTASLHRLLHASLWNLHISLMVSAIDIVANKHTIHVAKVTLACKHGSDAQLWKGIQFISHPSEWTKWFVDYQFLSFIPFWMVPANSLRMLHWILANIFPPFVN